MMVDFKSRFNIGDYVFTIDADNMSKIKVEVITFILTEEQAVLVYNDSFNESELFSKDEVIKHLNKEE